MFFRSLYAIVALMFLSTPLFAVGTNFNVASVFNEGLSINGETDTVFGGPIIYTTTTLTIADAVLLDAQDGSQTFAGTFSGPATGQRGEITILGNPGATVEVFCTRIATMTDGAGGTFPVVMTSSTGSPEVLCNNLATPSQTITLAPPHTVNFGARLRGDLAVGFNGGDFSTANAGGSDVQIDAIYQ